MHLTGTVVWDRCFFSPPAAFCTSSFQARLFCLVYQHGSVKRRSHSDEETQAHPGNPVREEKARVGQAAPVDSKWKLVSCLKSCCFSSVWPKYHIFLQKANLTSSSVSPPLVPSIFKHFRLLHSPCLLLQMGAASRSLEEAVKQLKLYTSTFWAKIPQYLYFNLFSSFSGGLAKDKKARHLFCFQQTSQNGDSLAFSFLTGDEKKL